MSRFYFADAVNPVTPEELDREITEARAILMAMLHHLDLGVGRVVNTLKKEGIWENTLLFFLTDNGGCYRSHELAAACDEIILIDDRSSAVSLPEVPLLGVLPGTGGLTRVTDKRRVRRDHADVFCTLTEGVRAARALECAVQKARHLGFPLSDLVEGTPLRAEVKGQAVVLVRSGGTLSAIGATCSHWGGPLDEGELVDADSPDTLPTEGSAS